MKELVIGSRFTGMCKMPWLRRNSIAVVLILAAACYFFGLNQSLWLDEGTTARVVQHYDFLSLITQFSPSDFHPPLYYLVMKVWTGMFGTSEMALRMPSLLSALLAGYVVYLIARELKISQPSMACAFFVFQPLIVYYAQEARMYLLSVCLLAIMLLFALRKKYIRMGIFAAVSLGTFYGSIFFIAALALWLAWKRDYRPFIYLFAGSTIAVIILSPLLYMQLANAHNQLSALGSWRSVLGTVTVKNLALFPLKFAIGRVSFTPKWFYWLITGAWTALVIVVAAQQARKNRQLTFLLLVPVGLGVLASFITPLLSYFRFLYLSIPLALLLTSSSKRVWILGGFILWSLIYLFIPAFHREDWKSLATSTKLDVVYGIPSSLDALRYYAPQAEIRDIRTQRAKIMTVIPYTFSIYGVNALEYGYRVDKTIPYRGVSLEYWTKNEENR